MNKPETGTDSEATKLPEVTDPKSAETTPSESPAGLSMNRRIPGTDSVIYVSSE